MTPTLSAQAIKTEALRLGFSACGLAPADAVDEQTAHSFRRWIADGCQGSMAYLQNYEEKRMDPRLLVEGTQTVVSLALNYYPATELPAEGYRLAWYAYGKDYHEVMKEKLSALLEFASLHCGARGRAFCDTAPLLERYWAWRAGLGWIGKHTQLIVPQAGSSFFLGELLLDLPADAYDTPQPNRCGSCTRCLDACPTGAIEAPFRLHAKRCLSYLTIEHRGALPPGTGRKMGNTLYGCDECQRACPWQRFATPTQTPAFAPSEQLMQMTREAWHHLTKEEYRTLFKGSAVKRAKYEGLVRNIDSLREAEEPPQ